MYTTTVLEFLQVKYGMKTPTTMTKNDAKILGIPYPMRPRWLAEHGPRKVDMQTLAKLLDELGKRVLKSARKVEAGLSEHAMDVCWTQKKNLEEFYGEPVLTGCASIDTQIRLHGPAERRLPIQEKEVARPRKPNTQVAAEIKAHRAKQKRSRSSSISILVEGVDVRSKEFLGTYAWTNLRIKALTLYGRKCMCCGDSPENGAVMNVDHIKPRVRHPHLALDMANMQILCGACNKGKCNELETDYRSPSQRAAAERFKRASV